MTRYINRIVTTFTVVLGSAITLLVWIVLSLCRVPRSFVWALLIGASVAVVAYLWMVLRVALEARRYKSIDREWEAAAYFVSAVQVTVEQLSRSGRLYLLADRLLIYFRDREPHTRIAFSPASVSALTLDSSVSMTVEQGGHRFGLALIEADGLADAMEAHGWRVRRATEQEA